LWAAADRVRNHVANDVELVRSRRRVKPHGVVRPDSGSGLRL